MSSRYSASPNGAFSNPRLENSRRHSRYARTPGRDAERDSRSLSPPNSESLQPGSTRENFRSDRGYGRPQSSAGASVHNSDRQQTVPQGRLNQRVAEFVQEYGEGELMAFLNRRIGRNRRDNDGQDEGNEDDKNTNQPDNEQTDREEIEHEESEAEDEESRHEGSNVDDADDRNSENEPSLWDNDVDQNEPPVDATQDASPTNGRDKGQVSPFTRSHANPQADANEADVNQAGGVEWGQCEDCKRIHLENKIKEVLYNAIVGTIGDPGSASQTAGCRNRAHASASPAQQVNQARPVGVSNSSHPSGHNQSAGAPPVHQRAVPNCLAQARSNEAQNSQGQPLGATNVLGQGVAAGVPLSQMPCSQAGPTGSQIAQRPYDQTIWPTLPINYPEFNTQPQQYVPGYYPVNNWGYYHSPQQHAPLLAMGPPNIPVPAAPLQPAVGQVQSWRVLCQRGSVPFEPHDRRCSTASSNGSARVPFNSAMAHQNFQTTVHAQPRAPRRRTVSMPANIGGLQMHTVVGFQPTYQPYPTQQQMQQMQAGVVERTQQRCSCAQCN